MSHADSAETLQRIKSFPPLKDCSKIYVASLVCIPPDGKAQAKRVLLCVFPHIRHSDSAWSLRNLRFLREKIKQGVYASNT